MRLHKFASAAIFLSVAVLALIDILRASVGARSLIAWSGLEIFAFFEFILLIALLLVGLWRLKSAGVRYRSLLVILVGWLSLAACAYKIVSQTGISIAKHWDSQVFEVVSTGRAADISDVQWDLGTSPSNHCRFLNKKQLGIFFELFEYRFECDGLTKLVRLSLNHRSGGARVYVALGI